MIIERLYKIAQENAERVAFVSGEERLTYRELWKQAFLFADGLKRQGCSPVLLYAEKQADMLAAMLSCLLAGRAYVPLSGAIPEERLRIIAERTGAELCLTLPERKDMLRSCCRAAEIYCFAEWKEACTAAGGINAGEATYEAFRVREAEERSTAEPDTTAYIIFTSGSTGEPKGVPIGIANLSHFADWISGLEPLRSYRECSVLNQASFGFDLSVADIYYTLCNGHTLVANRSDMRSDYERIFELFAGEHIRVAVMTPTGMNMCLLNADFNEENYPELRCVYFCGERLEKRTAALLRKRFPGLTILNAYGPTEATSAVSAIVITREMLEAEEPLPVGEVGGCATEITVDAGELVLKGASVSAGYLGGIAGGFFEENGCKCYRTGDLGAIRDGRIYCLGRMDTQIKYKGYRIELGEIEAAALCHPEVTACAAVPSCTAEGKVRSIRLFYEGKASGEEVREALAGKLPEYMIPAHINAVTYLPVNANGKIDRKRLHDL